jgi:hemerythrin-like domain-containing protein
VLITVKCGAVERIGAAHLICGKASWRAACNAGVDISGDRNEETAMTHATVRIIHREHAALSAMLRSILLLLAQHRRLHTMPDFSILRAMLFYVDEFPEQRHHRKESSLLFPLLRARTPLAGDLLDQLDAEHARGEAKVRELEHALLGFEMMGEARRAPFEQAAERYVDFYLAHMATEEEQVLPLAERVLTAQDWAELDAAFSTNCDPLTGHEPGQDYRALFTRIVNIVPAPIGLGAAG